MTVSKSWMSVWPFLLACSGSVAVDDTADTQVETGDPPVAPLLVINEFLASNDTILADSAGEYDDWLELYNAGDTLVNFEGLYLTDDLATPTMWPLPAGEGLDAGEFLLIWGDGDTEQGVDHTSFKIDKEAGVLALYIVADGYDPVRVDGINYESQPADLSAARVPDGSDGWEAGQTPSPGTTNGT